MTTFKVTFEIETEAHSPLQAARIIQNWLRDTQTNWQFYVQNDETKELFSVDLSENTEDAVIHIDFDEYKPQFDL